MAARTSAFSHLLQPVLHDIFFNRYNQWPEEYSQIFNVLTTDRAYEEDSEVTGLGKLVKKTEGQTISYDDPKQAKNLVRYTPEIWSLGFRVSYELYKNDLYNIINKAPEMLARSARQTIEAEAWNVFNQAFSTAYPGRDGKALCAIDHPNIAVDAASGPYSNRLATDSDLSITALQAAVELLEGTTDDRDLNLMIKPKTLLCTAANKWMARELLNSEQKPHTSDNEINALSDEDLKYMVGHFLTDNDAWFLIADKLDHYLRFYFREQIKFDNDDEFDTGDAKFKAMVWFKAGFSGWRGVIGTPGA